VVRARACEFIREFIRLVRSTWKGWIALEARPRVVGASSIARTRGRGVRGKGEDSARVVVIRVVVVVVVVVVVGGGGGGVRGARAGRDARHTPPSRVSFG